MDLSVIVPLYTEEECITLLYDAIVKSVDTMGVADEILFVDDGSKYETVPIASALAAKDKRLRVVKFRRNYGQTPAMAAGIDNANGKILVTMDGDLQNDPDDIPMLVRKIDEGYYNQLLPWCKKYFSYSPGDDRIVWGGVRKYYKINLPDYYFKL